MPVAAPSPSTAIRGKARRSPSSCRAHNDEELSMTGPGYILLIDDDSELRQSLVDLLEDEGHQTRTASSGREALAMLEGPDLPRMILLDLMMPDLNGWQFCELQRQNPRLAAIPVLVVTA